MRFHVLAVPHAISVPEYSSCAFTQKVLKLCRMLVMEGHTVIHYGHERSKIAAEAEHVTVTTDADLDVSYPGWQWKRNGFPPFKKSDPVYGAFYLNTIREIAKRKQPGDILCITFGDWQKEIATANPDLIAIETGIGYPNGAFAKFRVYESYAIMHAYQGNMAAASPTNDFWYDKVIPNSFDLGDFAFNAEKQDFFLFLGRVNEGKGIHIAKQIAEKTKTRLIVAGPGVAPQSDYIDPVGAVGPAGRKVLLRKAKAVICASTFLEPFCGVQIEAMASGTPVISTDRGAFAEYNINGVTGYRCSTFEQFEWAARNIDQIKPKHCREWAERFSLASIAPMYSEYARSVSNIFDGKGFYAENPDRLSMEHATFSPF